MDQLMLKYNQLSNFSKREITDFLDYLLSKETNSAKDKEEKYKNKILKVSTWTDDEIAEMERNIKTFGKWNIQKW